MKRPKRVCMACCGRGVIVTHEWSPVMGKTTVRTPCKACKGRKVV